jgi:leucyl/phenylalanyl-tRNA--protein transferase
MIPFLAPGAPFPPVSRALRRPNGLLAAGGDLSMATLVRAYASGIFPWYSEGDPVLWWSPDPRMVLVPAEFHLSRSLARRLTRGGFHVTIDEAFDAVLDACAAPRDDDGGTWLLLEMQAAYSALHDEGLAHSIEVWAGDDLAGGLYGVSLGRMFFGESMFSRQTDGSKVALAWLCAQCVLWEVSLIDCQMATPHLASLGAREVPRRWFTSRVAALVREPGPAVWAFDAGLDVTSVLRHASAASATR